MIRQTGWGALAAVVVLSGCRSSHQVNMTHDVQPIRITLDVNLKVDRELDNFFDDIDEAAQQEGRQGGARK